MSFEKHQRLVRQLIKKTDAGELNWTASAYGANVFEVSFPETGLRIREEVTSVLVPDVFIDLLNSDGQIVETFSDGNLGEGWYQQMSGLFESARRVALGSDKVLNSILSRLEEE